MSRSPRPDDLYTLRTPLEVRVSPDGTRIAFVVKESAPVRDSYRMSLWVVPADGSAAARQVTLGARRDTTPRWSPDGRTLAFLSDRAGVLTAGGAGDRPVKPGVEPDGRGATQVWLLPMEGGEASQLTRLPDDVSEIAWSPDGSQLCLVSAATTQVRPDRRRDATVPSGDARLIDRLQYQLNGSGFIHDKAPNLWLVDVVDGVLRRLTSGTSRDGQPAWSPDGSHIAFVSDRHADADLTWRTDVYLLPLAGGRIIRVTGGRGDRTFGQPTWSPDGRTIAAVGHRFPAGNASANSLWLFPPVSEALGTDVTRESGLEIGAGLNSDLAGIADPAITWSADGTWLVVGAPIDGSYQLWRVSVAGGRVEQLTAGEHAVTRPSGVPHGQGIRFGVVVGDGSSPWEVARVDIPAPRPGGAAAHAPIERLTGLMDTAWADITPVRPVSRWHEVDGRRIQGWFLEAPSRAGRPAPLVVEIHGGPATMYGWSLMWEWQCLVAAGISVYACNPRGSQGYGQDFCYANFADWGDGPMRDIMAGVDALVTEGRVDPQRLGVTGGSYGGYLTAWMVGHTDRFAAAVSCRGVYDLTSEMLTGDVGGPLFGRYEYGVNPWDDPDLYRRHSPISYATDIHTPLLIQHAEDDLRCPITQAEELFTILRSHRRPVRLMRVPAESHELTRSGAPFRRVENIVRIRDWFVHYLVEGHRGLPRP